MSTQLFDAGGPPPPETHRSGCFRSRAGQTLCQRLTGELEEDLSFADFRLFDRVCGGSALFARAGASDLGVASIGKGRRGEEFNQKTFK